MHSASTQGRACSEEMPPKSSCTAYLCSRASMLRLSRAACSAPSLSAWICSRQLADWLQARSSRAGPDAHGRTCMAAQACLPAFVEANSATREVSDAQSRAFRVARAAGPRPGSVCAPSSARAWAAARDLRPAVRLCLLHQALGWRQCTASGLKERDEPAQRAPARSAVLVCSPPWWGVPCSWRVKAPAPQLPHRWLAGAWGAASCVLQVQLPHLVQEVAETET